jgi:hypothetical protein
MFFTRLISTVCSCAMVFACPLVQAEILKFTANLTTTQTVPPSDCVFENNPCSGTATLTVDTLSGSFSMSLTYTTGRVGAMHLDLGAPGTNGTIQVLLEGSKSVPLGNGTWRREVLMSDGLSIPVKNMTDLIAGNDYIVIFPSTPVTRRSPDLAGALRGQLRLVP